MLDRDHKAHVSVYYNGPALIVLKTGGRRGDEVSKDRLALAADGSLHMEIVHIDPQKEPEKLVFKRKS